MLVIVYEEEAIAPIPQLRCTVTAKSETTRPLYRRMCTVCVKCQFSRLCVRVLLGITVGGARGANIGDRNTIFSFKVFLAETY